MRLNPVPTELTTAATDVLLGVVAVAGVIYLYRLRDSDRWKVQVWAAVLGLLAVASLLGAVAHGLELEPGVRDLLWQPLFVLLGLVVALFVVAAVYDWRGRLAASRMLPAMVIVALGFYAVTRVISGTFLVFIAYEAAAMVLALSVYTLLAARRRLRGAGVIAMAIALNILAAAIQATGTVSVTIIWPFDHNGVFHLVQMAALVVLVAGLQASLRSATPEAT
ncbi:MAG: hypothetical protein GTO22_27630 [Gemmatimonadales bacterium]|nr:hypothetical protein [Gemmatimonadales bacterium]